ncbi:beta-N-acetylglucosaminidase domain-containing protein [Streptomyces sp. NBC_01799]|uniref:beta-N-acetylglucosaminidase domain-containing protein n=1 Tax=Streptomyces sp. NBC_01800 TaxID=2975945 RepID=UPI002DD922DB|nr:beta-N-acetylglucosaminidase domain-containing protein [Streptomyces sp. NBC_01800]WSA68204.1 beta-N-acetylglucosaminidase domain-containing protein [Streptomyces sp. NBC_01800]WSA76808.1 beta-N-acetylglucosaminidase domain-containing protein [Streptomyces sp. NBC_01799]
MRLRHRKHATAVAVAVLGGLLSTGTPAAFAAPSDPGSPAVTTPDRTDEGALPTVWPRPQTIKASGAAVPLADEVTLVADAHADPYAVDAARQVLRDAGVRTVHEALPGRGPVIRLGGNGAQDALRTLRAPERADLPSGGYRIAVGTVAGRSTVALDGVGDDGLFHAVQTLRQLVRNGSVAGVTVRDWPGTAVRGMTEGFYGQPWTREERLAQIDFMGRTKQNRYLYAAGDDPYRQARWRDPYPAERRADFRALAERARARHVTLGWAVAPGQAMCMSSDGDVKALTRKIDAMWALGVRVFQLQFQDVSYSEWHCDNDAATFGRGPEAAARAQARVASEVARHLAQRHPGSEPLSVMPTEFYQDGATDYRTALAKELDDRVQIAWTGVGVVPRTITGRELAGARATFRHPLVTMDNYPVNDYAQDRIFLGPYTGRDPAVAIGSAALLANAMEQPSASRIPLFTAADFAWNPKGYLPQESWQAAIDDLAGDDAGAREALRALARNSATSVLGSDESAYLQPLLAAFWKSRATANTTAQADAARELRAAFTVMRQAPQRLKGLADGRLDDEVRPWTEQLARYGRAGELAVDLLQAQALGDGAAAWKASLALEPLRKAAGASGATVGKGVLGPFLDRVRKEADAWTGADRDAGTVTEAPGSYTVRLKRARPMEAVTAMTVPGVGADATLQAHVPGEGWRSLGPVSRTGWTQTAAEGLRTDAIRLIWPTGSLATAPGASAGALPPIVSGTVTAPEAPQVRALVPWFGDEPAAWLDLVRGETDAEIGGRPQRVEARLAARRPAAVRGALTAKAPKGIKVSVPGRTTVPRGSRTDVPVEITVPANTPAGEYQVPFRFGGEESTLTVRAYPRTAGPDLVRTATASSSGDETPDFPAAAASDGDPTTRWSSPAEDGAWWQAELTEPARIGQVVLQWQDAYASRYRVQVSADGRTWRTAATVRDGNGGRESVRMDAKDTRFVRIQGDGRGTEFGYSLWSVEAYAVAE